MITTSQTEYSHDGWIICLSSPDNKIIRIEETKQTRFCEDYKIDMYHDITDSCEKMHFAWAIKNQFYARYARAALDSHRLNLIKADNLNNWDEKQWLPSLVTCRKRINGNPEKNGYVLMNGINYFEITPNRAKNIVTKYLKEFGYGMAVVPDRHR